MSRTPQVEFRRFYKFFFESIKPFRRLILAQLAIMTFWAIDLNVRPYLLKKIIDQFFTVATEGSFHRVITPIAFYLGMSLMIVFFHGMYDYIWLNINPPLRKLITTKLASRMMKHSQTLFKNHLAGSLANKIRDVAQRIPELLKLLINSIYSYTLAILMALYNITSIHPHCGTIMLTWLVTFFVGTILLSQRARRLSTNSAELNSGIVGRIVDLFSNILNVRLFCSAPFENRKLKRLLDQSVNADQTRDWCVLQLYAFQGLSFVIYQAACIAWLIIHFHSQSLSAGDFALVFTLNAAVADCLWDISDDVFKASDYCGTIIQGLHIALTPATIRDCTHASPLTVTKGAITFDAVNFSYNGIDPLFENKSVTIEAGQKVGLVGYSGSGKSTFINLILRLYDVESGAILIDGQNVKQVTQRSLHEAISVIPQDPSLFHRSLMENIRYGRAQAKFVDVIAAAQAAHAHEFISALPEGYNTLVGEHGASLSGGQRQRVIIARAILKNAPIVILDEVTSHMDVVTEQEVQQSLYRLMESKTCLVIAHRLATLVAMDRILVFDKGKIVQDGTHQELVYTQGLYKTLWDTQVNGCLPEKKTEIDTQSPTSFSKTTLTAQ